MEDRTHERNLGEARLDARYNQQLHALSARLYRRIRFAFAFITLVSGTAAFSLLVRTDQALGAWAGAVLAIIAIADTLLAPADKSAEHGQWARRFGQLLAREDLQSLDEFDAALEQLRSEEMDAPESLGPIAYNRNVTSAGYESWQMPLTAWQRFLALLV